MPPVPGVTKSKLQKQIDNYLYHLKENDFSSLTLRNYRHYLTRLVKFIQTREKNPDITHIDSSTILSFNKFIKAKGLSDKTLGYHLIALRSLLRWLRKSGVETYDAEKIEVPKSKPRKIKFLSGNQIDSLLNAPSLSKIQGKRDKAILELLYSTGLRVSDLTKLNRDDIQFEKKSLRLSDHRRRAARFVFLSRRAADWIDNYLRSRSDTFSPLFIRHKGKISVQESDESMRLSVRSVQRMLKKYVKKIRLPVDATPHVLRHSFATDLLMAGADLRSVQEMLGHKNVQTTQIYTHVTHKHLKDVHSSFHGRGGNSMITLILPGYSPRNKEWAKGIKKELDLGHGVEVFEWEHWSGGNFSIPRARDAILKRVQDEKVNIIAKSVGTRVTMHLIPLLGRRLMKVVLCGIPTKLENESVRMLYKKGLSLLNPKKIIIFQNENDPFASFEVVEKFVHSVDSGIKVVEKNRSDHHYPYPTDFRAFLKT